MIKWFSRQIHALRNLIGISSALFQLSKWNNGPEAFSSTSGCVQITLLRPVYIHEHYRCVKFLLLLLAMESYPVMVSVVADAGPTAAAITSVSVACREASKLSSSSWQPKMQHHHFLRSR